MLDLFVFLLWFGPPVIAGGIVIRSVRLDPPEPAKAYRRGLYRTLGIGIALGFCAGLIWDLFISKPGEIPATPFMVLGQVMISGIAGFAVGAICRRVAHKKAPQ